MRATSTIVESQNLNPIQTSKENVFKYIFVGTWFLQNADKVLHH